MSDSPRFCAICGLWETEHPPAPPPGPPDPPPEHHEGVWRPRHAFTPSAESFAALLDERDAQIKLWRSRAVRAERRLAEIYKVVDQGERGR